jgi:indolepyruvate ferredoxin oxidoreductase beta subunit
MSRAIISVGRAVQSNLGGFAAGFERALTRSPTRVSCHRRAAPRPSSVANSTRRIKAEFPAHLHGLLQEGVRRLVDYQDGDYATAYLDRLHAMRDAISARKAPVATTR